MHRVLFDRHGIDVREKGETAWRVQRVCERCLKGSKKTSGAVAIDPRQLALFPQEEGKIADSPDRAA
jgi:hypothetical protein